MNTNDGILGYLDGGYLPNFWNLFLRGGSYDVSVTRVTK